MASFVTGWFRRPLVFWPVVSRFSAVCIALSFGFRAGCLVSRRTSSLARLVSLVGAFPLSTGLSAAAFSHPSSFTSGCFSLLVSWLVFVWLGWLAHAFVSFSHRRFLDSWPPGHRTGDFSIPMRRQPIPDQVRFLGGLPLASTEFHGWLLSLSGLFPSFASFPGPSILAFL